MTMTPYEAGYRQGYNAGWVESREDLEPELTQQYQLGHADGLGQRCQHHFAYWNTWWGFLIFCFGVNLALDILKHMMGWH